MATYALIPGGGDPWEWHRLVRELAARGPEAIAIRLPAEDDAAGWSEYTDAVVYFHDLPPELQAEAQARTWQDQSMTPLDEPSPLACWPDVPPECWPAATIGCSQLNLQRRIARERLGIDVDVIDGGHMVAMSNPGELANQLEAYRFVVHGQRPVAGS